MDEARLAAAATLAVDAMTVEVVGVLHEAGVRPILLKGATFAALLYPEGGRTYRDCDLLVAKADLGVTDAVLTELGFVDPCRGYAPSEGNPDASTYWRGQRAVDLHWNLHCASDAATTWNVLSAERDTFALGGRTVDMLSVAGRAMHVALHAAHHGVDRPRYGFGGRTEEDLRRALRVVRRADWKRAAELAHAIGAANEFAFGLRLEPDGRALAEDLALADPPSGWRPPTEFDVARGAATWQRLVTAPTFTEKLSVLFRAVVPSRARARRVADTKFGRASLPGAYLEFWGDSVRGLVPALRDSRPRPRRATSPRTKRDARND